MAKRSVLGLFQTPDGAADGVSGLKEAGFDDTELEVMSDMPYPEGSFGEGKVRHRLYFFPLVGALCGLSVAIVLTVGTQAAYPLVTGGKPILSLPPMTIIAYEGTLLGAILFTVLGVLFESRLPRPQMGLYDTRITEGFIGLAVTCDETRIDKAEQALRAAGAEDVKTEQRGRA